MKKYILGVFSMSVLMFASSSVDESCFTGCIIDDKHGELTVKRIDFCTQRCIVKKHSETIKYFYNSIDSLVVNIEGGFAESSHQRRTLSKKSCLIQKGVETKCSLIAKGYEKSMFLFLNRNNEIEIKIGTELTTVPIILKSNSQWIHPENFLISSLSYGGKPKVFDLTLRVFEPHKEGYGD